MDQTNTIPVDFITYRCKDHSYLWYTSYITFGTFSFHIGWKNILSADKDLFLLLIFYLYFFSWWHSTYNIDLCVFVSPLWIWNFIWFKFISLHLLRIKSSTMLKARIDTHCRVVIHNTYKLYHTVAVTRDIFLH